jgi:DnaJ-class molecular chaperone
MRLFPASPKIVPQPAPCHLFFLKMNKLLSRASKAVHCLTSQEEANMSDANSSGNAAPNANQRNPGDEAAPGTPQTAEDICPDCGGSGKQGQAACANCGGTGRIVKIVGDA